MFGWFAKRVEHEVHQVLIDAEGELSSFDLIEVTSERLWWCSRGFVSVTLRDMADRGILSRRESKILYEVRGNRPRVFYGKGPNFGA